MTTVAYLVFTFIACFLGVGMGLALHATWTRQRALEAGRLLEDEAAKAEDVADFAVTGWEALQKVEAANNRRFALSLAVPALLPLVIAAFAWNFRDSVVHSVCSGLAPLAGQTPLCLF